MSSLTSLNQKYKRFCQCMKVKLAENKSETKRRLSLPRLSEMQKSKS